MKVCKVRGCNRGIHSKSLCGLHYLRLWRTGSVGSCKIRPYGIFAGEWYDKAFLKKYAEKWRDSHYKTVKTMHKLRFGGLREIVLERDSYTCQICGMTNKEHILKWNREISVDHKDGLGRYSEIKNHSLNNLWTLCLSCHSRKDSLRYWLSMGKTVPINLLQVFKLE